MFILLSIIITETTGQDPYFTSLFNQYSINCQFYFKLSKIRWQQQDYEQKYLNRIHKYIYICVNYQYHQIIIINSSTYHNLKTLLLLNIDKKEKQILSTHQILGYPENNPNERYIWHYKSLLHISIKIQSKNTMQQYAMRIRTSLWTELKKVFDSVSQGNTAISMPQVQYVVKNVIGQTDKLELDYIFKNQFRLDTDNTGSVNFNQFSNFFLKRHCGEIALQRTHKKGLIGRGAQRKLNVDEFLALLNDAYSFLKVDVENGQAREVFKVFDSDKDNLITYVEYFSFIQKFICKNQATLQAEAQNRPVPLIQIPGIPEEPIEPAKVYQSRLRYFLWNELRALFDSFDTNFDGKLQLEQARNLIRAILKMNSQKDIDYVLFNIFQIGDLGGQIEFVDFCPYFVEYVCNLGISSFLMSYAPGKRVIDRDQFVRLFRNSFYFLKVSRIKDQLLWGFFQKIDDDYDGLITFDQYIDWVKSFLCPVDFLVDCYYFQLDDMSLPSGLHLITDDIVLQKKEIPKLTKFKFTDYALAHGIRAHLMKILSKFDKNKNYIFEESQVVDIMQTLLKQNEIQVFYVIHNVFRYDRDDDNRVTYPEMANFLLEFHCGEMAIQRRHLKDIYKYGPQRMMDEGQFIMTLKDALGYLQATATDTQLKVLFSDVDLNKDGKITYKEYFQFLILYFGSQSIAAAEEVAPLPNLTPEQEFAKWLNMQSTRVVKPYQLSSNLKVNQNILADLLRKIFKETEDEVDFVLRNLFRLIIDPNIYISDDDLRKIIVFLHVGLINLLRGHKARKYVKWNEFMLNKEEFIQLVLAATEWASVPSDPKLLSLIFDRLDTDHDGYITYKQYLEFIRSCILIRTNKELEDFITSLFYKPKQSRSPIKRKMTIEEQKAQIFYTKIWEELRALYNSYLPIGKQHLLPEQIKKLIIEVLQEVSLQEHQYVFWNFFRLDKDGDGMVSFQQFAPYILAHSAEIALQRFHFNQPRGKNILNFQQFVILANKAYGFLKSISKQRQNLQNVYNLLDRSKTGRLSYGDYLRWSLKEVAEQQRS